MSIVKQIVIESRRYSGWLDPRYPIGYWQGALTLTGDASGGTLGMDLMFQTANGVLRLNSQMYSVERFSISTNDVTDRLMILKATNMGGPANEGFRHEYTVQVNDVSGVGTGAVNASEMVLVPWFLGSQRTAGITASLSVVADNLDTVVYEFEAEGYRWGARSVLVDGGPQRPPTGPYRQ